MPTRRQYLTSVAGISTLALAGCTGVDLPESVEPPAAGWGVPQGSVAGTRTNPTTDYITTNLDTAGQFDVTDVVGDSTTEITAAIPQSNGIVLFTESGVVQMSWSGEEQWSYETNTPVLTGAVVDDVVVVVLESAVIGVSYRSGEEEWSYTGSGAEQVGFSGQPTFTEYLTTSGDSNVAGVSEVVCVGTVDETGLIGIDAARGSIVGGYVSGGTGVLEANPTYDTGNGVIVLSMSNTLVGVDVGSFDEVFVTQSGVSQDLFTHYGLSIVHAGAGSVFCADTTVEQQYEGDVEADAVDARAQWSTTELTEVQAAPALVGAQAVFPTSTGVEAVSIGSGEVAWVAEELGSCASVASSKGHLYVLTQQNRVYVLDGHTGSVLTDYAVEGEWSDISVFGEYVLVTGSQGVGVVTGDSGKNGLAPLVELVQGDLLSDRITFKDSENIIELTDDSIDGLDDVPGSDISGLLDDIVAQYERGEIPYILARNMFERMVHYFTVLDLGLEFVQRNQTDVEPFTVGENRLVSDDSLLLPPELWEVGGGDPSEYSNADVSLALAYTRRSARAVFDALASIPGVKFLKAPKMVYDFAMSEFASLADDTLNNVFKIVTGSGVEETERYINRQREQGEMPRWLATAMITWIQRSVVPLSVTVDAEGDVNILRPADLQRAVAEFVEFVAQARAQQFEYGVEIPRKTLVEEYTDIDADEYMVEVEDENGNTAEVLNEDVPSYLRHNFTDTYQGITAADVPRNVTESDLLSNLDRIDSLPGNQRQAMAASTALQRGITEQTQTTLAKAHPLSVLDGSREEVEEWVNGWGGNDGEEETVYELAANTSLRGAQGVAELVPYGGIANLTNTLLGMVVLRGGINGTMSVISDQTSHDVLFGVHESDPGEETLLSRPRYGFSDPRTAFTDYEELTDEGAAEQDGSQESDGANSTATGDGE